MEQLRTYLNSTGETQRAFAARIGISPSHLNEIISRRKRPSLDVAFEITRATEGKVPVESWDLTADQQAEVADHPQPEPTNNESPHDTPPVEPLSRTA